MAGFDITPGFNLGISDWFRNKPVQTTQQALGYDNTAYQNALDSAVKEERANKQRSNNSPIGPYTGGGSGGGVAPTVNPGDLAYLDDQQARAERQRGSIDRTFRDGMNNLGDSFNRENSRANQQRSRALENFGMQREDTTRDKQSALGRVDTNARTLADSVRRQLGMASGSGSSAYQLAAPNAVNRVASSERSGVLENYGENFRDLGLAENRAKEDFATLLEDLAAQRRTKEQELRAGIEERRLGVDETLSEIARQRVQVQGGGYDQVRQAMSPYANAIDARQSGIDGLAARFRNPYSVKAVNVKAPSLRDYVVDGAEIGGQVPTREQQTNQFFRPDEEEQMALV